MIRRFVWRKFSRKIRTLLRFIILMAAILFVIIVTSRRILLAGLKRWLSSSSNELYPLPSLSPLNSPKYAYATLLCDDVMTDAIKVLIYSLKKTSNYPFLLLVLPGVKERQELVRLGAEIHEISMLDYPFRVTAEKAAINKMCRYSKLHIWRFTQYEKIIFIDVDCLVLKSLDPAFKWPEFSAVRDAGDTFNTGLFVLQPSLKTWDAMKESYLAAPSYNQGDQGFINWFFRNSPKTALPVRYNTVCKHKSHAVWPLMKRQAKMIHYTSETKPWNFFLTSHKFWRQNFDSLMYYQWARTFREVSQKLKIGKLPTISRGFVNFSNLDVYDPKRPMWLNARRSAEICEKFFHTLENKDSKGQGGRDKISIVITKWRSIKSLIAAINHYRFVVSSLVHRIFISWNPSLGVPGIELARFKFIHEDPKVELITHRYESVNNIWSPIINLATQAVFMADDEHLPDLEKLEVAFETWKNNKHALVGFFPRYHTRQHLIGNGSSGILEAPSAEHSLAGGLGQPSHPDRSSQLDQSIQLGQSSQPGQSNQPDHPNQASRLGPPDQPTQSSQAQLGPNDSFVAEGGIPALNSIARTNLNIVDDQHLWIYNITGSRRPRPYSLLSSQLLLLNSEYLFIYTCLLPERIHRQIDEMAEDGADLAMNVMVAGMTGSRPIAVKSDFVDPEAGRFAGEAWALNRGQQLKDLIRTFTAGQKDPLQLNSVIVTQFNKIPFKKRSVKQWNKP